MYFAHKWAGEYEWFPRTINISCLRHKDPPPMNVPISLDHPPLLRLFWRLSFLRNLCNLRMISPPATAGGDKGNKMARPLPQAVLT